MPKSKNCKRVMVSKWIAALGDNSIVAEEEDAYCKICDKQIRCDRKSQIKQHLDTGVHTTNKEHRRLLAINTNNDSLNEANSSRNAHFYINMYQAMVAVNMPGKCLNNELWRNFLKKYTDQDIPNESTFCKHYLHECYHLAIETIRKDIGKNNVWISVDETMDAAGRNIANLTISKLYKNGKMQPHLLACKQLTEINHQSITRFVDSAIKILWPRGGEEKILLLITDAKDYMLKSGRYLKIFFPNMLHVTCLGQGLNRIAEEVRFQFPAVDKLISTIREVFLKAPLRVERYKNELKNLPLPPEPVSTKWGTWLEAAFFYAVHLKKIKDVVELFNEEEAPSIRAAKEILKVKDMQKNLTFIETHFRTLSEAMRKLEMLGLPLTHSMDLVNTVIENMENVPGDYWQKVLYKFQAELQANSDFDAVRKISNILRDVDVESPQDIPEQFWRDYKYAPVTMCDVARSFSAYTSILADERHDFINDNLEKIIVTYCSSNYQK